MTNSLNITKTAGKDIRVGDMLKTWFGMQRVVTIAPRTDEFAVALWGEGQSAVVVFDSGKAMTIARNDWLEVVGQ